MGSVLPRKETHPNAVFASLVNSLVITPLVSFYSQTEPFWKCWIYYLDPYNYLMSSLLIFTTWDKSIHCTQNELAIFNTSSNQTCGEYLVIYQRGMWTGIDISDPEATADCLMCQYTHGGDYLKTLNLTEKSYGWRNSGIVVVFVVGTYGLVYFMMKPRKKATSGCRD